MKIRILAFGLASATTLFGQYHHRFSWQEACFKNPALPYCPGHDFAVKHRRPSKDAAPGTILPATPDDFVVDGIDWRFADPGADWLAGLNFSELPPSPLARKLMVQVGAKQGLIEADIQKIFDGLSCVRRLAVSAGDNGIVMMITRSGTVARVPALEPGWKAIPAGENILIGHAVAVDQAMQRMKAEGPLAELTILAVERQGDSEFWAAGSGKLAGNQAATAGVRQFSLVASIQERVTTDTLFELSGAPDASTLRNWPLILGKPAIDGNFVRARVIMEGNDVQQRWGEIAGSLLGERLRALLSIARHLPARETNVTGHTRPVIQGLDGGPQELGKDPQR